MTTRELIAKLLECDLDAEVRILVEASEETINQFQGEGIEALLRINTIERTEQIGTIIGTYEIEY